MDDYSYDEVDLPKYVCPICGGPVEVYSRVVGYLRPIATWNPGKQEEFRQRVNFDVK